MTNPLFQLEAAGQSAWLAGLEARGVPRQGVTDELVTDGVRQFTKAFDRLFAEIARRRYQE